MRKNGTGLSVVPKGWTQCRPITLVKLPQKPSPWPSGPVTHSFQEPRPLPHRPPPPGSNLGRVSGRPHVSARKAGRTPRTSPPHCIKHRRAHRTLQANGYVSRSALTTDISNRHGSGSLPPKKQIPGQKAVSLIPPYSIWRIRSHASTTATRVPT